MSRRDIDDIILAAQDVIHSGQGNKACNCGDFKEGRSHINCDAVQCKNCGGWMSGIRMMELGICLTNTKD